MEKVRVDLGSRGYDILVGRGLIETAGPLIRAVIDRRRVVVVTDRTVAARWLAPLERALTAEGIPFLPPIVVDPGEPSKDFATLQAVVEGLLARGADRWTVVIALGGGVVGDLAGFAAAVCLRGLDFIQVPTSLLAQVDSSVGGKTGINAGHGKNLVGAFHQPRLVLADIDALDTLSPRHVLAGYAEVVKYGLIDDRPLFAWLEAEGAALCRGDHQRRSRAVAASCAAKARIVEADEREADRRALLNLGHTFGHALEAESGFGDAVLHGEAVAVGMVLAFRLSVRLGLCPAADAERVTAHLAGVGLPTRLPRVPSVRWDAGALLAAMARDKKAREGRLTLVLARGIGESFIAHDVDAGAVRAVLEEAVSAGLEQAACPVPEHPAAASINGRPGWTE